MTMLFCNLKFHWGVRVLQSFMKEHGGEVVENLETKLENQAVKSMKYSTYRKTQFFEASEKKSEERIFSPPF